MQLRSSYESISKNFNNIVDRNKQAHCGDSLHALTVVYVIKYYTVISEIGEKHLKEKINYGCDSQLVHKEP